MVNITEAVEVLTVLCFGVDFCTLCTLCTPSYILIRKRNAKKMKHIIFLETDHFDGVLSDIADE